VTTLLSLRGFLPAWDLEKRTANVEPILQWLLDRLRLLGYPVERLEDLPTLMTPHQALDASRACTTASLDEKLRQRVSRAIREAIPELLAHSVWLQTRTHFRILLPGDTISPVPPHTDYGFGHGLEERNVWFSLTNVDGNAALHALPLAQSMQYMARTNILSGVFDQAPHPPPIATRVGDVLLFTPLHIHRAHSPAAHQCRVSFDVRLIPKPLAPKDATFAPLDDLS
jgi:hypothetical protein